MPNGADLLGAFEEHSPSGIRALLAAGVSPSELIDGKRPIDALIETYLRSTRFAECLRIMWDAGATLDDPLLEALLLDNDAGASQTPFRIERQSAAKVKPVVRFHLLPRRDGSAYLRGEFNSTRCAHVLLDAGADVNARADLGSERPWRPNTDLSCRELHLQLLPADDGNPPERGSGFRHPSAVASVGRIDELGNRGVRCHPDFLRAVRSLPSVSPARRGCIQQHRVLVSPAL